MILYFNSAYLNHPAVKQTIINHRGQDTFSKLTNLDKLNTSHTAWYSRTGNNMLPFKNGLIDVPGFAMPDYNPNCNRAWTDVTDQRCMDLRASDWHRPWVVFWSGGIDSTVIV
jgi:asparagine synthetase B (glutamine-hydrolysing)